MLIFKERASPPTVYSYLVHETKVAFIFVLNSKKSFQL